MKNKAGNFLIPCRAKHPGFILDVGGLYLKKTITFFHNVLSVLLSNGKFCS